MKNINESSEETIKRWFEILHESFETVNVETDPEDVKTDSDEYIELPSWSLPYFVNNDFNSLSEEDKKTIEKWKEDNDLYNKKYDVIILDDNEHFSWNPAFGLATNVVDAILRIDKNNI